MYFMDENIYSICLYNNIQYSEENKVRHIKQKAKQNKNE